MMMTVHKVLILALVASVSTTAARRPSSRGLQPQRDGSPAVAQAANTTAVPEDGRFAQALEAVRASGRLASDASVLVAYEKEVKSANRSEEAIATKWLRVRLALARTSAATDGANATRSSVLRPVRKAASAVTGLHHFFGGERKRAPWRETMLLAVEAAAYRDAGKLSNASLGEFNAVLADEVDLSAEAFADAFAAFEADLEVEIRAESARRIEAVLAALQRPDFAAAAFKSLQDRKSPLLASIKSAADLKKTRGEMLKLMKNAQAQSPLQAAQVCAQLSKAIEALLGTPP